MTSIPTEFPSSDPQDLAAVTPTQVHEAITGQEESIAGLRAKYGPALAETSVEGRALAALEAGLPLLNSLLTML